MAISNFHVFKQLGGLLATFLVLSGAIAQDYSPPPGYYDSAEGLLGEALKGALHDVIDGHTVLEYDALPNAIKVLDADPDPSKPDNIILLYSGYSVPGFRFNTERLHSGMETDIAHDGCYDAISGQKSLILISLGADGEDLITRQFPPPFIDRDQAIPVAIKCESCIGAAIDDRGA